MKRILLSAWLLFSTCGLSAQVQDNAVLLKVAGRPVTAGDFLYAYGKNKVAAGEERMPVREYLNLFIDFRLKVEDALTARLDTVKTFRDEFRAYRDGLLSRLLIDQAYIDSTARAVYDQEAKLVGAKDLLKAEHILLSLPSTATQEEKKQVERRADSLYVLIKSGADFEDMARRYSEDRATAGNGGLLPTIMPGSTLKAFEEQAYSLRPGEIGKPFQTEVGFHIVKLLDRRPLANYETAYPNIVAALKRRGIEEQSAEHRLNELMAAHHQTRSAVMDSLATVVAAADPEQKHLLQEYHDGLLLYAMAKRKVWDVASTDAEALERMFRTNRSKYVWNARHFKGYVVSGNDEKALKAAKKQLSRGIPPGKDVMDFLRDNVNRDSVVVLAAGPYLSAKGENATIDRLAFKDKSRKVLPVRAGLLHTILVGKVLKRPENYEDVRGEVITDLQLERETSWLNDLRRKYPVKLYTSVLESITSSQTDKQ